MNRREFISLPFSTLLKPGEQSDQKPEVDFAEVLEILKIQSTHSLLRDEALLSVINAMAQDLGFATYMLGYYGTLYKNETVKE